MQGADTELDRQVLEVIKDPLTHMVRNSADHGIETPARAPRRRQARARHDPPQRLSRRRHDHDRDRRRRARARLRRHPQQGGRARPCERGRDRADERRAGRQVHLPSRVSRPRRRHVVSGRGVGMDVVKTNIELIGGTVEIRSEPGRGTTFTIKIPLTLAIVAALIVTSQDQRFAIPQVAVLELVRVTPARSMRSSASTARRCCACATGSCRSCRSRRCSASRRGERRRGLRRGDPGRAPALRHPGRRGLPHRGDRREADVLEAAHIQLFSGNTILGDGAVVLIIDPNGSPAWSARAPATTSSRPTIPPSRAADEDET